MSRVLRNTALVGALTALSRVLGLVREMLQSRLIGAGVEQSAFTLAFALPNMARKIFGEGALTAAFVPLFKDTVEREGLEKAARLARAVMSSVFVSLFALCVLSYGALGAWMGLVGENPRTTLVFSLVATLIPYLIFICGAAFGMGVLNALGRFRASSFMPTLLNLVWIAALGGLCFFPSWSPHLRVQTVAWAILAAGLLQMAFMFVCMARAGVKPFLVFRGWREKTVRRVWRNVGVGALGAGAVQANCLLDQVLAQLASPWAAGVIGYAERLMDLPLGVIGVAFGTVLLPTLAGHFSRGDAAGARATFCLSVKSLMFVMLPAAAGLCVLAPEVTRVVYEGGDFDALATVRVSRALSVYALGLGFFGFQKTLVPWFHAQNDLKTPLRVSVAMVVLNAALNVAAVWGLPVEWRHAGLAVSTVVCAGIGCLALAALARRKNGALGLAAGARSFGAMVLSALAMAVSLAFLRSWVRDWPPVLSLGLLVLAGAVVYAGVAAVLLRGEVRQLLRRRASQERGG
jgi:putative peptidoglycan lipid II flippase